MTSESEIEFRISVASDDSCEENLRPAKPLPPELHDLDSEDGWSVVVASKSQVSDSDSWGDKSRGEENDGDQEVLEEIGPGDLHIDSFLLNTQSMSGRDSRSQVASQLPGFSQLFGSQRDTKQSRPTQSQSQKPPPSPIRSQLWSQPKVNSPHLLSPLYNRGRTTSRSLSEERSESRSQERESDRSRSRERSRSRSRERSGSHSRSRKNSESSLSRRSQSKSSAESSGGEDVMDVREIPCEEARGESPRKEQEQEKARKLRNRRDDLTSTVNYLRAEKNQKKHAQQKDSDLFVEGNVGKGNSTLYQLEPRRSSDRKIAASLKVQEPRGLRISDRKRTTTANENHDSESSSKLKRGMRAKWKKPELKIAKLRTGGGRAGMKSFEKKKDNISRFCRDLEMNPLGRKKRNRTLTESSSESESDEGRERSETDETESENEALAIKEGVEVYGRDESESVRVRLDNSDREDPQEVTDEEGEILVEQLKESEKAKRIERRVSSGRKSSTTKDSRFDYQKEEQSRKVNEREKPTLSRSRQFELETRRAIEEATLAQRSVQGTLKKKKERKATTTPKRRLEESREASSTKRKRVKLVESSSDEEAEYVAVKSRMRAKSDRDGKSKKNDISHFCRDLAKNTKKKTKAMEQVTGLRLRSSRQYVSDEEELRVRSLDERTEESKEPKKADSFAVPQIPASKQKRTLGDWLDGDNSVENESSEREKGSKEKRSEADDKNNAIGWNFGNNEVEEVPRTVKSTKRVRSRDQLGKTNNNTSNNRSEDDFGEGNVKPKPIRKPKANAISNSHTKGNLWGMEEETHFNFFDDSALVEERVFEKVDKPMSTYERARFLLREDMIFTSLPCRSKEQKSIETMINQSLREKVSKSILISGVPGTGKTATINSVLHNLTQLSNDDSKFPHFIKVVINGLKLSRPNEFYRIFYRHVFLPHTCPPNSPGGSSALHNQREKDMKSTGALGSKYGKAVSDSSMLKEIVERFELDDPNKAPIILILDEIDYLVDATVNKQPLIYNIFEWTKIKNARLVVVGLSNRLNFVEFFENKVQSRMGFVQVIFSPYTADQLVEILNVKLRDSIGCFDKTSIKLIASKVASHSGDIRRAVQYTMKSIDSAESEFSGNSEGKFIYILPSHVSRTIEKLHKDPKQVFLRGLSHYEKLFLVAVIVEKTKVRLSATASLSLVHVLGRFERLQTALSMELLNATEAETLCSNLTALGFVQLESCYRNGRQRGLNRAIDTELEKDDLLLNLGDCDDILRVID